MTSKFGVVPTLAILDKSITHAELRVFSLLCSYADKHGECFPSQNTMCEQLGVNRQTMNKHMQALVKHGWVTSTPRHRSDGSQRSNLYRVIHDRGVLTEGEGGVLTQAYTINIPPINTPPIKQTEEEIRHDVDKTESGMSEHLNEVDVDDFSMWFAAFPRQQNRQAAGVEYRLACRKTDAATLLRSAESYARETRGTDIKYIKRPDNWLRDGLWEDQTPAGINSYYVGGRTVEMTAEMACSVPNAIKLMGGKK